MARFFRFFAAPLTRLHSQHVPLPALTIGRVMAGLSVLGVLGLGFLGGAAIMFFQLPPCDFLEKAFAGARAWRARGRSSIPHLLPGAAVREEGAVTVDQAEKTSDGFTLYTATEGSRATLIDMHGSEVHHWELPFSRAWAHPPHVEDPLPDEQINWFHCYLYPNGDLLAVYHADGDTPYGYGLVKLNKDSQLLWAYPGRVHHSVDVGEDGTIYTLTQKLESKPPTRLRFLPTPYLADSLVVLSQEGRELDNIPIAEAFANSPYVPILTSAGQFLQPMSYSAPPRLKNDLFHANSVRVLKRARAAKFSLFKAGQILLSVRNLNTIAVLDRQTRSVAWAAQGIWRVQHDAEYLDNGHLLLYDNFGARNQARILEYDPVTQAIPWVYANEDSVPFHAFFRGMKQRLPNDNTLIVDPDNRRLFEVTQDKELVWAFFCPLAPVPADQRPGLHAVNYARRYHANELTFLKGAVRARP
ncbi:MAG TPA: arylsulfotransferase family protein [Gemmataceae bacterium]|jgi:hypothetical protein